MSGVKAGLKAAKAALDAHNYSVAVEEAERVLQSDPKTYHAQVFLGLALEKQAEYDRSEIAYVTATKIKERDLLAWQGMVSLYEKQAGRKLDQYHDAALRVAELYMDADDRIKCQSVIDKYTLDAKKFGSRTQYKRSLEVLLPSSPIFEFLEGRIPQPASTFIKIVEIVEAEETEKFNAEIGQRRTRLGAKIDQVVAEVRREVFEDSPLETLYTSIIDWTLDDEVRREYEEKLLKRAGETLAVLSLPQKPRKREQVQKLANGLVLLKHPFLLAWKIELEWKDVKDIGDLDVGLLTEFVTLFPNDGLAKVARGFLGSDASPFLKRKTEPHANGEDDDQNDTEEMSLEDRLMLMVDGMDDSSNSILSHRLMGNLYIYLEEYESAVKTANDGLKRITSESNICGLSFVHSLDAMKTILASGLVQYQAPRHHPEARSLFEDILSRNPTATSALIGIGMIYEEQEDYSEAGNFLDQALQINPSPKIRSEAAWCRALNGDNKRGLNELESCLADLGGTDVQTRSVRSQTLYRIGMCMWLQDTSSKARKDRNGAYARFLSSLQADMNFAPAYTSLGIYYADYARDRKRARKCFQKAFELSALEVTAAERLARSFAISNEWDLVEVVAQRVVDSGRTKPAPGSRKKGISWPHAALGVVQLHHQEYPKSIVSFQAALRISPDDYNCWVGLGEGYHNSGRYVAATRAFEHAQELQKDANTSNEDVWFAKYMLANVKRELGEYDSAVAGYQEVLSSRPAEYGISMALLQCLVDAAWHGVELGFFGRAAESASEAIRIAKDVIKIRSNTLNLWKATGDACSIFTSAQAYTYNVPLEDLKILLTYDVEPVIYDTLSDIDGIDQNVLAALSTEAGTSTSTLLVSCVQAAILAHKRAIHACANDVHAKAVAWYNLGWIEHRAHTCGIAELRQSPSLKSLRHLKAAVQCFKRAIEMEAGNAEFWNALGVVTSPLNPKVSQHSFVRSLHLNERNARVWTNLGAMYILQGDVQLANEAFTRAQSADPDYAQAWLGQGMLADRMGGKDEARSLFTHAFEIADSSSEVIEQQYALSAFDHSLLTPLLDTTADVLQPLFSLQQLRSKVPNELAVQHLSSLFQERVSDFSRATSSLEPICATLETDYETTESQTSLIHFAQAKADLARCQLAQRAFSDAAENAETALNLSAEEDGQALSKMHRHLRLSAHMTAGLAYYHKSSMDDSISMFKAALAETDGDPSIICLLSQVLWAKGGADERAIAHEQLLDCIEKHPGHVGATTLLGAIAILENDTDTLAAVTADLESLQAKASLTPQQQGKIAQLLAGIAALFPSDQDPELAEKAQATKAVMLRPWKPQGWGQLAKVTEDAFPAEAAVHAAVREAPPHGMLDADGLCRAFAGTTKIGDAQRAVMVAPWVREGWEAFV